MWLYTRDVNIIERGCVVYLAGVVIILSTRLKIKVLRLFYSNNSNLSV